jgi:hypothetical protein
MNTFVSSMIGGVIVGIVMAPFDVISTRLYNQGEVLVGIFIKHILS